MLAVDIPDIMVNACAIFFWNYVSLSLDFFCFYKFVCNNAKCVRMGVLIVLIVRLSYDFGN